MKSISKVAVLIVVHNRFEMTKACINALIGQGIRPNMIVLVDDGSTDGTESKARSAFPGIHLVRGDGSLYWCGAMAIAEAYANEHIDFEFLLWVNNDVALADSALSDLLSVASEHPGAIIAGSMVSSINHSEITYSGFRRNRLRFGFTMYSRIESVADAPVAVDTFNGNLVLVPKNVAARLGAWNGGSFSTTGTWIMAFGRHQDRFLCGLLLASRA
ncbi:glycosyltransferase family 2 protein [Sinomonas atrocyanea]